MKARDTRTVVAALLAAAFALAGCASGLKVPAGSAREAGAVPADAAPGETQIREFMVGVGDTIELNVYRHEELHRVIKIDLTGKQMFPLIGDVQVAGRSLFDLRDEVQRRYGRYLVNPSVDLSVTSVQSRKFLVLGEVRNPGYFVLDQDLDVMDAISKAGGFSTDAKSQNVALIRRGGGGKPEIASLNLRDEFMDRHPLRSGDVVYVPRVAVADASWFMAHLSKILSPVLILETGVVLIPQVSDALKGESSGSGSSSAPIVPVQ